MKGERRSRVQDSRRVPAVVLAAGYGSLQPGVPKVCESISARANRPMIAEVLNAISKTHITCVEVVPAIVVINGLYQKDIVSCVREFGRFDCQWVGQPDRLGAGDAVKRVLPLLEKMGCQDFLVTFADMPLWQPETISRLVLTHLHDMPVISMVTVALDSLAIFWRYGRILRGRNKEIAGVVEPADATETQLMAATVNPSLYVFNRRWFEKNINRVKPREKGDGFPPEVHLPPLVAIAHEQGERIAEVTHENPIEALGVNTMPELEVVRKVIDR